MMFIDCQWYCDIVYCFLIAIVIGIKFCPAGDSLLHMCARAGKEEGGVFLVSRSANPNVVTSLGETPLHTACEHGLSSLANTLLHAGANPNAQTTSPNPKQPEEEVEEEVEVEIEEVITVAEEVKQSSPSTPPIRPSVPQSLSLNHRISLNPFGDCDDEDEQEVQSPFEDNNPFAETPSPKVKTPSPKTQSPVKQTVKRLVKQKQKVKKKAAFRQTPLHLAIMHQHKNVVEVFLQYKGKA